MSGSGSEAYGAHKDFSGLRGVWYRFLRVIGQILSRVFYRLRVEGVELVPSEGGVLYAANHQSFYDPVLIGVASRRPVYFTPRKTLTQSRVYRLLTSWVPLVPVERGKAEVESVRRMIDLLRDGAALAVFPEQTRTSDGTLGRITPGFQVLAQRSGVPVVPVAIQGAYEVWPRRRRFPRIFGRIRVRFGEPIAPAGLGKDREGACHRLQQALFNLGVPERASGNAGASLPSPKPIRRDVPRGTTGSAEFEEPHTSSSKP